MKRAVGAVGMALALIGGLVGRAVAESEPPPPIPAPPRYLIEVLTFGPGDHPFTRFGHNAIRVVDRLTHQDFVYNFGTFSIGAPGLIPDFLRGRLRYWLSVSPTDATVDDYREENRTIEAQGLALSPDAQAELARRLAENARPENRAYRYDYFRDNCSTRVRDALDGVTGGALRVVGSLASPLTLRDQALRMAADDLPFYLVLSIVLGPATDRPIDTWAADFLPQTLQRTLRLTRLVANERVVFAARRPLPRSAPPSWGWRFLGAGVAAGVLLLLLGWLGRWLGLFRMLLGVVLSMAGTAVGFVGTFLVASWWLTPHAVVYANQNILLFAPFALALGVLGWGVAFGWPGAIRKAFFVAAAALGLSILAILLKPVLARQDNAALIAFAVPLWLGMTLGTRALFPGARSTIRQA